MEVKTEDFNPWTYKNTQEYLYFCCAECDFKDRNEANFIKHAVTHHSKAKNVFSVQIQESQIVEDFSESIPTEEEPLSEIDEKQEFHEIISETVGAVRFKCSFCDYKSKYKQAVTHHVERVHLKKRDYNCDQCKKSFHQECDLRKHINTVHLKQRRFVCETCGFPCVTKQSLEKHIINKHKKPVLQCSHCNYTETSAKRFYNHYNLSHIKNLTNVTTQCHTCARLFENEFILKLHIEFDHQATKYWCDQCGKQFSSKKGLNFHVSGVHQGFKPYKCDMCDKAFPSNGNLQTHIKIAHTKTGSVKCKICGQGSANIFYARKHMKEFHS